MEKIAEGRAHIEEAGHNQPPLVYFEDGGMMELPRVRWTGANQFVPDMSEGGAARQTHYTDVCGSIDELKRIEEEEPARVQAEAEHITALLDDIQHMMERMQRRWDVYKEAADALSAAAQSVKLGDTKEGTFAVRMATELEEQHMRARGVPRTGKIANADGAETEAKAWGKRSRWVDYSGSIGGTPMGVAIFDHPANPKHPTYWHVRGYGLFAANPFGEHDFHADPSRDGSITLAKGEILRFRYRIVIHPGRTADADLNRAFQAWAAAGSK